MKDWIGRIDAPGVALRFANIVRKDPLNLPTAVCIHRCDEWPPMTVGVLDGHPCMSGDLHDQLAGDEIIPENN